MTPEVQKISDELQVKLSPNQLEELVHDLEIKVKDEYYKKHPEETNVHY